MSKTDLAIYGAPTLDTLELGGLTFSAAPVTVADWAELLTPGTDEVAWMVGHLRERLRDDDPALITPEWYEATIPALEHQSVTDALLGNLKAHPTAKGKAVLRLSPGRSDQTFLLCGVRFMAGTFTRAEVRGWEALHPMDERGQMRPLPLTYPQDRAAFMAAALRKRVHGGHDPITVTAEWYMRVPTNADRAIAYLLLNGFLPGQEPKEDGEGAKKKG